VTPIPRLPIAAKVSAMESVWLATRGEIAAHVRQALG
jgi:hypothetical protein